jgi:signal transduction histidine kinase
MLPDVSELVAEPQPDVVSSLANVIEFPVRHVGDGQLERDIVLELATADDLALGMGRVAERIRRSARASGVQWCAVGDDGALEPVAAAGSPRGPRRELPIGSDGVLVLYGGRVDPDIKSAVMSLASIVRRRTAEERLARKTVELARRNEALEDFAALVAHELKTPLQPALVADDPSSPVEAALDLVDALLEAAQTEAGNGTFTPVEQCLEHAVEDLKAEVEVAADLATTVPLPPGPLRVILRNLLSNAVSAGAQHVHVTTVRSPRSWRLLVDDDGVGLADVEHYAAGSGIGLSLSRRIAARFGAVLELTPGPVNGTRATLEFAEAPR